MDHCCLAMWKTAKRTKLCEISLYHWWKQSQKWQWKNAAEVVSSDLLQGTKLFSLTGELQGSLHYSDFMPLFADSVAWYLKSCINRNPFNKKHKWKLDILKLHDLHTFLNINAVWSNCRLLHMERKHYFWGGNDPCGDLQRFKIKHINTKISIPI